MVISGEYTLAVRSRVELETTIELKLEEKNAAGSAGEGVTPVVYMQAKSFVTAP